MGSSGGENSGDPSSIFTNLTNDINLGSDAGFFSQLLTKAGELTGEFKVENGQFQRGAHMRAWDELVGGLTGKNAARKDLMDKQSAIAAEEAKRRQQLLDEQALAKQKDVNASLAAGAIRSSAQQSSGTLNPGYKSTNDLLGSRDFLGL